MPKKKKNGIVKKIYWGVSIVLMLMIIIGIILLLMGVIKFPFSQQIIPGFGNLNIIDLFGQQPSGSCTFTVDDDEVCLWTNVTGTIRANSPICYIGYNYNNEGWRFAGIIDETSLRFYKESRQATATGHYEFAAICGTPLDFCRTNDVEVDVIDCGDGEWEDVGYTCGWVGEQCGGTCPDSHPLCVDVWFEQNVLWIDDGYVECVCLNPDTEEIHPSWKPDGQYHENEDPFQDDDENGDENGDEDEEPVLNCIDSDGENPFTKGITTYLGTPYPDVCHAGWGYAVDEYVCIDDVAVKKEISCPYDDCVDGRCTSGTTTVYQECLALGYISGGYCIASSPPPSGCVIMPSLDTVCGNLYPLNPAICCN